MIKYQNTTNKMAVCYGKITNLTLRSKFTNNGLWTHGPIWPWSQNSRSKVTNNGTRHIVWGWSTYMPNMKSLSWTTKKLQSGHNLLWTHGPVWPWGQNSWSKVTNNGTRHIVWRWSTYMPIMQSLSWTTKKLQPRHDFNGHTDERKDAHTDHYRALMNVHKDEPSRQWSIYANMGRLNLTCNNECL